MEFQTRRATAKDREPLFALYGKVLRKHIADIWGWNDEWQKNDFDTHFRPEDVTVLLDAGRIIGYMQAEDQDDVVWLRMIVVQPEYQSKGIGGSVLRQLITRTNGMGKDIALAVFKINTDARRLYERLGFVVEGETSTHFNMRRMGSPMPNQVPEDTARKLADPQH